MLELTVGLLLSLFLLGVIAIPILLAVIFAIEMIADSWKK
jgi:hypothetical protein